MEHFFLIDTNFMKNINIKKLVTFFFFFEFFKIFHKIMSLEYPLTFSYFIINFRW